MANYFLTPVGRLVQGSPGHGITTDSNGQPLLYKSGPNVGQPRTEYPLRIAIPKSDPMSTEIKELIEKEALASWPGQQLDTLSTKISDGDSTDLDKKGTRLCDRKGYAGNWIIKFSGSFMPQCYSAGGKAVIPAEEIKTGYYVRVYGSVSTNKSKQSSGVYVNHSYVELVAFGEEISSAPAASSIFAQPAASLPAGASATPLAPATTVAAPAPTPAVELPIEYQASDGNWYTLAQCKGFGWTPAQIAACATRNV